MTELELQNAAHSYRLNCKHISHSTPHTDISEMGHWMTLVNGDHDLDVMSWQC